jgi:hypothetical protein
MNEGRKNESLSFLCRRGDSLCSECAKRAADIGNVLCVFDPLWEFFLLELSGGEEGEKV